MVPRFTGAALGLLAFFITTATGLWVRNPVEVTLSRSLFALFAFCLIGLFLGGAAQMVINEHERRRQAEILEKYREEIAKPGEAQTADEGGGRAPVEAAESRG
jgi:hypothetical protein